MDNRELLADIHYDAPLTSPVAILKVADELSSNLMGRAITCCSYAWCCLNKIMPADAGYQDIEEFESG